jgi:DHA2 family multidrug resistance protein
MYNRISPNILVGIGVLLFVVGSWQLSHITLDTGSRDMVWPLIVTGFAFAFLFVPLTTAALSKIERHEMADAAGLNSFVRQIGGSIGLTIFATLFTSFTRSAASTISSHITVLRPEIAEAIPRLGAHIGKSLGGQATVLAFDRLFLLQGILFIGVLPLLYFMRVPRVTDPSEKPHIELAME